MSKPMEDLLYLQSVQAKSKRQILYNLRLSQHEYVDTQLSSKIKDAFKRMKSYYVTIASVGTPGAQ